MKRIKAIKEKKERTLLENAIIDENNLPRNVYKNYIILFGNGDRYIGYTACDLRFRCMKHEEKAMKGYTNSIQIAMRKNNFAYKAKVINWFESEEQALLNEILLIHKTKKKSKNEGWKCLNDSIGGEVGENRIIHELFTGCGLQNHKLSFEKRVNEIKRIYKLIEDDELEEDFIKEIMFGKFFGMEEISKIEDKIDKNAHFKVMRKYRGKNKTAHMNWILDEML